MANDFFQRLSFTLTKTSLIAAFSLGATLSSVQVYLDFTQKSQNIDTKMEKVLKVSSIPAQRAIRTLDFDLAAEVVEGLKNYHFLHYIAILDERGRIMAIHDEPLQASSTFWLTQLVKPASSRYAIPLKYKHTEHIGELVFNINNDQALAPLYNRSIHLFFSGLAKNLLLGIILACLFHKLLTRPLRTLAERFNQLNRNQLQGNIRSIQHIKHHEQDELGHIVNAANKLIDDLAAREHDLEQNEKQLRIILNASPSHIFALNDQGNFVFLNQATARFYNTDINELKGQNFLKTHVAVHQEQAYELYRRITQKNNHRPLQQKFEFTVSDFEGVDLILQISATPYTLYNQSCILVMCNDITARVEAEYRVEKLSYFDTLTHLPNKNQLEEKIKQDVQIAIRKNTYGALLYIDIDEFKRINDTMGHSVGDALLLKLSARMQTQIRKSETLARISGDEFILSVPDISGESCQAIHQAKQLADRLLSCIRQPVQLGLHEFEVSASIGIALYPDESKSIDTLLSNADTALHRAKREGHDRYVVFERSMSEEISRLINLETALRKALNADQFEFYLQPLVDSHSWEIVSAEALLRWRHPTRGIIPPDEFIEFLENSPMISKVGELILNKICAFIHNCRNKGTMAPHMRIAVNVSAREFYQASFVEMVTNALSKYHLHGSCLEIEITESAALCRMDEAVLKMKQLKELGVHFALDDFGTGYSSLSYLKELPFDKIKIDKSFIKDITMDPQDGMLVASIIAIGDTFKLQVVAEGVETEDQAAWLNFHTKNMLFQGFLFDRPLSPSEFERAYLDECPTMRLPLRLP
ncbi:Cyclic di-GMP phosphodiesterase Gmr [Thalassocella blandensis]|nr:Cyclic di-GMP phosphodiesterase Gmr [Thalassocella blandensis]